MKLLLSPQKLINRFTSNFQRVAVEGIFAAVFLVFLSLVISGNIIRVIAQGTSNYTIYEEEKANLEELEKKSKELTSEKDYVLSDEYKLILLRESSNLAQQGEELYRTREDPIYFQEEKRIIDVTQKKSFVDWWESLIR